MSRSYKTPIDKKVGRKLKTPIYHRNKQPLDTIKMSNIDEDLFEEEFDDEFLDEEFEDEDEE